MRRAGSSGLLVPMILVLVLLLWVLTMTPDSDYNGVDSNQYQYCQMVAMYDQAEGIGWPDYRGTFAAECNEDGSVKRRSP